MLKDNKSWMTEMPSSIRSQPINYLAIPGSHDSFTYAITASSKQSPDSPVYDLLHWLPAPMVGIILQPWTTTQTEDVVTQLNNGIRYFDLRVATYTDGTFWLAHAQYAMPLFEFIKAMVPFLDHHPQEVVLLDVNHSYNLDADEQKKAFEAGILELIGDRMAPQSPTVPSLDDMSSGGHQILFFSCIQGGYASDERFWRQNRIQSFWPNTDDPAAVIAYLEARYGTKYPRSQDIFNVYQFVLTINESYFFGDKARSLRELGKSMTAPSLNWLQQPDRIAGYNGVNITLIDFCIEDNPEYIDTVIGLNHKTWPSK